MSFSTCMDIWMSKQSDRSFSISDPGCLFPPLGQTQGLTPREQFAAQRGWHKSCRELKPKCRTMPGKKQDPGVAHGAGGRSAGKELPADIKRSVLSPANNPGSFGALQWHSSLTGAALHDNQA